MRYRVRDHFCVHLDGQVHSAGTELKLTPEQAERHAAQIEEIAEAPVCKPRKPKAP